MGLDREYVNDSLEQINKCLEHFLNNRGLNKEEDHLQSVLLDFYLEDLKREIELCRQVKKWNA